MIMASDELPCNCGKVTYQIDNKFTNVITMNQNLVDYFFLSYISDLPMVYSLFAPISFANFYISENKQFFVNIKK